MKNEKQNIRDNNQDDCVVELARKYKKVFEKGRFYRGSYINQIKAIEDQLKSSIRVAHDAADENFQVMTDCLVVFEKNLIAAKRNNERYRQILANQKKSIAKFDHKLDVYSGEVDKQLIEIKTILNA